MEDVAAAAPDWTTWLNLSLAALSALMAALAGWINWWTWQRQKAADEPGVTFEAEWTEYPGVGIVRLEVNNRADVRWRGDAAQILTPTSARLLSDSSVPIRQDATGQTISEPGKVRWTDLAGSVPLHCELAPAGSKGDWSVPGSSARVSETLYIYFASAPSVPTMVSIRLTLRSKEGKPREAVTTINTTFARQNAAARA